MKKYFLATVVLLFSITEMSAQYCAATGLADCSERIRLVEISNLANASDSISCRTQTGYTDFTTSGDTIYLEAGMVYAITSTHEGIAGPKTIVWLDFNGDNVFDNTQGGEERFDLNNGGSVLTGGLTRSDGVVVVPDAVADGDIFRLRIRATDGLDDTPLGQEILPCGGGIYGEVEDYIVKIGVTPPPPGTCTIQPSNSACEAWISDINIPDANFSSFSDSVNCMTNTAINGYSDFFDTRIVTLDLGGTYPVDARNETWSDLNLACWIDWNIDGVFDNSETSNEKIQITSSFPLLIHQGVINVPADAKQGKARMRFKLYDATGGTPANPFDPCVGNEFEIQDFGVIIGNPIQCAQYTLPADNAVNICTNGVTLQWSAPTAPAPTGYKLFLGTDAAATSLINGQDVGLVTSFTYPTELPFNTTYFWKVIAYNDDSEAYDCETWSFTTSANADPSIDQILLDGIDLDSAAVCADVDLAILANISGGTGTVDFAWTGDDVYLNDNSINNPTFNASTGSQTYTLRLTLIDDNSCTARDSVKVYVKDAPVVGTLSADKAAVCANETVTLTLAGYNATITDWEKAEGANPYASVNHTQDVLATTINVDSKFKVLLTNGVGCEGESNEVIVTLKAAPSAPTIAVDPSNTACEGDTITLIATPGTDIIWNDTNNSTTGSIAVTVGGAYNVTYTDATSGCSAKSTNETITFNALPANPIITLTGTTCEGDTVTLSTQYNSDLVWEVDGISFPAITVAAEFDETYTVTYTDANTNCSSSSTESVVFSPRPTTPIILQSGDSLITNPAKVVNWLDAGGNVVATGESYSPDRTPGQTFTAVVVDGNNCESFESNEVAYDHTVSIAVYNQIDFAVFPNPATSELNVQVHSSSAAGMYQIKDMAGRTVITVELVSGINTISLAEIQSGIYMLQDNVGNTIRIVKQ